MNRIALLERYRTGYAEIADALTAATEADLDRASAPDEWTARMVVHHLADSETTAFVRLRRLIAEDDPQIVGYDEAEFARRLHYDRPIAASLAVVGAVREASLQLLERLTPEEWDRSGTHSESGPYTVDDWLGIYAEHCHDHADQIRRSLGGWSTDADHRAHGQAALTAPRSRSLKRSDNPSASAAAHRDESPE
jgi:hypothetical protein